MTKWGYDIIDLGHFVPSFVLDWRWSHYLSIYLYILSQPRKEDIRTGAQRHRAKKKKEYKAR